MSSEIHKYLKERRRAQSNLKKSVHMEAQFQAGPGTHKFCGKCYSSYYGSLCPHCQTVRAVDPESQPFWLGKYDTTGKYE